MTTRSGTTPRPAASPLIAAQEFVARVRRAWRRAELVRTAVVVLAVTTATATVLLCVDLLAALPASWRSVLRAVPAIAAGIALVLRLRHLVRGADARRLALLAEERIPALDGYLTTALETPADRAGPVSVAFRQRAEAKLLALGPRVRLGSRSGGSVRLLLVSAIVLSAVVVAAGPATVLERWAGLADSPPPATDALAGAAEGLTSVDASGGADASPPRITGVRWLIEPPAYTRLPAVEELEPASAQAYAGSRIRVEGSLAAGDDALAANVIGGGELSVERRGSTGWRVDWSLDEAHRGLVLEAGRDGELGARRVVPIRIREDRPPDVELLEPRADVVIASATDAGATGEVRVRASARDDFGVEEFGLNWIHSSGSGESFSFRDGDWDWARTWREGRTVHAEYTIDLASIGLAPGDIVHLRAVARDGNAVAGPGVGVSATRSIRVARDDEMAEITTLIGFPLEGEAEPLLSQRMIILMTEQLRDRAAGLRHEVLLDESAQIAGEQARLRGQTGEEVFVRVSAEEHGPDDPTGLGALGAAGLGQAHGHAHAHDRTHERTGVPADSPARWMDLRFHFRLDDPPGELADPDGDARARPPAGDSTRPQTAERLARVLELASQATGLGLPEEDMHFHDESHILSMNPTKLAAYNAMWEAERLLRQGELEASLPHQYEALARLQQMREENRVFVRGHQAVRPIDVPTARGTGRLTDVVAEPRTPGRLAATSADRLAEVEDALRRILEADPRDASLELAGLALRLLDDDAAEPAAAAFLSAAADAAAAGDLDRARSLAARARTALAPGVQSGTGPPLPVARDAAAAEYFRRLGGDP